MIEQVLQDYLIELLQVPVYVDVPSPPAASYVTIEKVGGGITDHIRHSSVAVQSYGQSRAEAALLNESVISYVLDAVSLDVISAVVLDSDYNFPMYDSKTFRYQAVFDITHY